MNFKSYTDMVRDVHQKLIPQLPRNVSAVYGVPRSGMFPAYLIATALHVPLGVAGQKVVAGDRVTERKNGIALLVDDSLYKGGSIKRAQAAVHAPCEKVVVYAQEHNKHIVSYYADIVEGPRVFEWNLFACGVTEKTIFDIDGVLCFDPPVFDDDGASYQAALRNAIPYRLPKRQVHSLCTNRLERWRDITEAWMKSYGIEYKNLYMQQYKTANERRKAGNANHFKASVYKNSDAQLFVESHDHHAKQIATLSKKPVVSVESMRLFK